MLDLQKSLSLFSNDINDFFENEYPNDLKNLKIDKNSPNLQLKFVGLLKESVLKFLLANVTEVQNKIKTEIEKIQILKNDNFKKNEKIDFAKNLNEIVYLKVSKLISQFKVFISSKTKEIQEKQETFITWVKKYATDIFKFIINNLNVKKIF
jgi:hypothetical protein